MLAKADSPLSRSRARGAPAAPRAGRRGEAGFALIEVMISAMLVAVIAIAMLDGFNAVGRTTSEQRHHDEAAVIASESQEQLRSDPVSALDVLVSDTEAKAPHTYRRAIGGETFTVVEEARQVTGATGAAGCAATGFKESSEPTGEYVRISSIVTWPQLLATGLKAVRQASTITPPDGSTLEVDVTNGSEAPVEGVSVEAEGVHTTTGSGGCVVYGAIPATAVSLKASKPGYVTHTGQTEVTASEVQIAPNITTHYPIQLGQAGTIEAHFTYEGKPIPEGEVEGETFVATQSAIAPEFLLSGKAGSASPATLGNVFPFSSPWIVYAGDCPADSPKEVGTESPATVTVAPGQTASVDVPMSHINLSVMEGSEPGSPGALSSTSYPVTLQDPKCEKDVAANQTKASYKHEQSTTSEGHLRKPYQPYGDWTVCLYDGEKKQTYTTPVENKAAAGSEAKIYLGAEGTEAGVEREKVKIYSNQATNTC